MIGNTVAQQNDSIPNTLSSKQKLVIGGLAIQQLGNFYVNYKWWWEDNLSPFSVQNDGGINNYSLGVDKVGHFFSSYIYFKAINEIMKYGEFSTKNRIITSLALPFSYALGIEIADGFSPYGFSNPDLLANCIGISYGFLQEQYPYLQNFNFKFSYYPTPYSLAKLNDWSPSDDYGGHIYWFSPNLHRILPKSFSQYWPDYLNIAVGYGIDHNYGTNRKYVIGFDWNLDAFRVKNKGLKAIKNIANYLHFPAPGVRKVSGKPVSYELLLLN